MEKFRVASLTARETSGADGQERVQEVLHTHAVSLSDVRRDLASGSLTVTTKAVVPMKKHQLTNRTDGKGSKGKGQTKE